MPEESLPITIMMLFGIIVCVVVALVWIVFPFIVMSRMRRQEKLLAEILEQLNRANGWLFAIRYPNHDQPEETIEP